MFDHESRQWVGREEEEKEVAVDSETPVVVEKEESNDDVMTEYQAERMTKSELIQELMESKKRTCLGVHFETLPPSVRAQQFGFSSMHIVEELAKLVHPYVNHPQERVSNLYEYGIAFRTTLLFLRKGDPVSYLFYMLPPQCQGGNSASDGDPSRTLRRWITIIMEGICQFSMANNIISWLPPRQWYEDTKKGKTAFADEYPDTLVYHVDGTVILTFCPACPSYAKNLWNSKHAEHALQVFFPS